MSSQYSRSQNRCNTCAYVLHTHYCYNSKRGDRPKVNTILPICVSSVLWEANGTFFLTVEKEVTWNSQVVHPWACWRNSIINVSNVMRFRIRWDTCLHIDPIHERSELDTEITWIQFSLIINCNVVGASNRFTETYSIFDVVHWACEVDYDRSYPHDHIPVGLSSNSLIMVTGTLLIVYLRLEIWLLCKLFISSIRYSFFSFIALFKFCHFDDQFFEAIIW